MSWFKILDFKTIMGTVGIGAILSAILVFVSSTRRNSLDYIVSERSSWRKDIQKIIVDIQTKKSSRYSLSELKSLINPYGKNSEKDRFDILKDRFDIFLLNDGHIWELFNSNNHLTDSKSNLVVAYLQLLWKHDWEKSKRETQYNLYLFCFQFIRIVLLIVALNTLLFNNNNLFLLLSVVLFVLNDKIISCFNYLRFFRRIYSKPRFRSIISYIEYGVLLIELVPYILVPLNIDKGTLLDKLFIPYLIIIVFINSQLISYLGKTNIDYLVRVSSLYYMDREFEKPEYNKSLLKNLCVDCFKMLV